MLGSCDAKFYRVLNQLGGGFHAETFHQLFQERHQRSRMTITMQAIRAQAFDEDEHEVRARGRSMERYVPREG